MIKARTSSKAVTLYALQAVLAVLIIASGVAKLLGAGFMVRPLEVLGVSHDLLTGIGVLEMIAGVYLLSPRGAVVGAFLVGCIIVSTLGLTLDNLATLAAHPAQQQRSFVLPAFLLSPVRHDRDV